MTAVPSSSRTQDKLMAEIPRARKRRAASLTAEALWNIQLEEDDVMSGSLSQHDAKKMNKPITLRESAKSTQNTAYSTKKKMLSLENRNKAHYHPENDARSCMHLAETNRDGPSHKVYRSRGKLTASVAPLVNSEVNSTRPRVQGSTTNIGVKNNESLPSNSPLLLLPISLDPTVNAMSRGNVPLLTLHASPVNVDLVRCLNPSRLLSPIVDVGSFLTGKSQPNLSSLHSHKSVMRQSYEYQPKKSSHQINTNSTNIFDQTEPLNLKLGESTIPSSFNSPYPLADNLRWKIENKICRKGLCNPKKPEEIRLGIVPNKRKKSQPSKIPGGLGVSSEVSSSYAASSPSSESSASSTDIDDSLEWKSCKKSQKHHIHLRCKAAPGPNSDQAGLQRNQFKFDSRTSTTSLDESDAVSDNNGWQWRGKPYQSYVYSVQARKPILRKCYPAMKRNLSLVNALDVSQDNGGDDDDTDDVVMVRDSVMMRADGDEQPFVAKVAALWEDPLTGTMMISLLWFYRPIHTGDARVLEQRNRYSDSELFASRHLDESSVACVEDKCYVLTYAQYCRFRAVVEKGESDLTMSDVRSSVPAFPTTPFFPVKPHQSLPASTHPSRVYFCRKLYDIKLRRVLKTLVHPTSLFSVSTTNSGKSGTSGSYNLAIDSD